MIVFTVIGGMLLSSLFVLVGKVGVACTKMHITSLEQLCLYLIVIFCGKIIFSEVTLSNKAFDKRLIQRAQSCVLCD